MANQPINPSSREAARFRKQRQRERQRAASIAKAEADAQLIEAHAERLTPAILRHPIATPDGRMLVGARVAIVDGRAVRAMPLWSVSDPLGAMDAPGVKDHHIRAGRQLQADWHDVGAGLGVPPSDIMRSGGSGGVGPRGHAGMLHQIEVRARLEGALAHAGAFAPSLVRVCLDCIPVGIWADQVGKTYPDALAWITAGLDRLALFYEPAPKPSKLRILTIGPARADYEMALADA